MQTKEEKKNNRHNINGEMFQSNHTQRRQIHTDVMRKDIDLP